MKLVLKWDRPYPNEDSIKIYRDIATMNPLALPTELDTLVAGTQEYEDLTVVDGVTYYYRVETIIGANNYVSEEIVRLIDERLALETGMWFNHWAYDTIVYTEEQMDSSNAASLTYDDLWANTISFALADYAVGFPASTTILSPTVDWVNKIEVGMEFYLDLYNINGTLSGSMTGVDGLDNGLLYLLWAGVITNGVNFTRGKDATLSAQQNQALGQYSISGHLQFHADKIIFTPSIMGIQRASVVLRQNAFELYDKKMKNLYKMTISSLQAEATDDGDHANCYLKLVGSINVHNVRSTMYDASGDVRLDWDEEFPELIDDIRIWRRNDEPVDIDDTSTSTNLGTVLGGVGTYTDTTSTNLENYYYHFEIRLLDGTWRSVPQERVFFTHHLITALRVSHYTFETLTSGICVDSWGVNPGQAYGTYALVTGETGNGINLDGTTAYVDTTLDTELDELEAIYGKRWGVELFFKLLGDPSLGYMTVIGRGGGNGSGATFLYFLSDGTNPDVHGEVGEVVVIANGGYTKTGVVISDANWHFAGAYFQSGKGYFRLDDQVFDINIGDAALQAHVVTLGAQASGLTGFLDGDIDSFRSYTHFIHKQASGRLFAKSSIGTGIRTFGAEVVYNAFGAKLIWDYIDNDLITNVVIYRSLTPIDTGSLPVALTTLGSVLEYTDTTLVEATDYYYLIDVQTTGPVTHFSTNVFVKGAIAGLDYFFSKGTMVWYDISDISTLFQDTAGLTPVTKDGDPVRRINDKSGNADNAIINNGLGYYRTDNRRHWIEFDGATSYQHSQIITGTEDRTIAACITSTFEDVTSNYVYSCNYDYTNIGAGETYQLSIEDDGVWVRVSGGNESWVAPETLDTKGMHHVFNEWGLSLGTQVENGLSYMNNTLLISAGVGLTQVVNTETITYGSIGLLYHTSGASVDYYEGYLHQLFVGDFLLTAAERTLLDEFMQTKDPDNLY